MKPSNQMLDSIIFSIKPLYIKLILDGNKLYEFRNFKPKAFNNFFWVYESSPSKKIKYLMRIENPVEYPTKIECSSYGVERFNSGEMGCKYAYKILELYEIEEPLSMEYLKAVFNFTPPQAYTYLQRNSKLQSYITGNVSLIKIF